MFKPIVNKLNKHKQNHSTIIRQIETFDEDVLNPLVSNHHEGIYGFEVVSLGGEMEFYTVAPSDYEDVQGIETVLGYDMVRNSLDQMQCYSVELAYPSFLPIKVNDTPLWDDLFALKCDMFIQFLIYKGQNNWRCNWHEQYEHFIMGNDYPSDSKIGRTLQSKTLTLIDRLSGCESGRKRIPQIEKKLLDDGYRVSFRIMLHGDGMESEIQDVLSQRDYFNELVLVKHKNKEGYIDEYVNRSLNVKYAPVLSETELFSLFMEVDDVEIANVNSKPSNVEDKQEIKTFGGGDDVLHSAVGILPKSTEFNKEIDEEIGDKIVNAIHQLNITKNKRMELITQSRGATLQRVILSIPNGVKYSDIEKNYKDIKAAIGYEAFTIEQGEEAGTICFNIPCEERDIVYLRNILETKQFKEFNKSAEIPLLLGIDSLGEPLFIDLVELPHLLVASTTGGGKSIFLNCLVLSLVMLRKPTELKLYIVDPKKVEFGYYNGLPHLASNVVTDVNEAIKLFESVTDEMDKRYDMMSKYNCRTIRAYNEKFPNKRLPYIVLVVDEMSDLMMMSGKEIEDYIVRMGQLARASGIHVIIATQRPDKDTITGIIKANMPSRIAFAVSDGSNSRIILDQNGAEKLLGKGDGLAKIIGAKRELIRFQSPVITLDSNEEEKIFDNLKKTMANGKVGILNESKVEEVEEQPIDKLKRIILESGETRITHLQKLMNIRINVVVDLMKQLVDEGFLSQEGRSYTINRGGNEE